MTKKTLTSEEKIKLMDSKHIKIPCYYKDATIQTAFIEGVNYGHSELRKVALEAVCLTHEEERRKLNTILAELEENLTVGDTYYLGSGLVSETAYNWLENFITTKFPHGEKLGYDFFENQKELAFSAGRLPINWRSNKEIIELVKEERKKAVKEGFEMGKKEGECETAKKIFKEIDQELDSNLLLDLDILNFEPKYKSIKFRFLSEGEKK